jgi:hypothetical protein
MGFINVGKNALESAELYRKPEVIEVASNPNIKEQTYQIYNRFDMKNFYVKTDGSLANYVPELQKCGVNSKIFG